MTNAIPLRDRALCSVNEAAAFLGTSRSKIYAMLRTGKLRAVQFDGRKKLRVRDLIQLGEGDTGAAS
jgi:excisionase family DNA binding protein